MGILQSKPLSLSIVAFLDYPHLGSRGKRVLQIARVAKSKGAHVVVVIPFPETPGEDNSKLPPYMNVEGFTFIRLWSLSTETDRLWMPKLFAPITPWRWTSKAGQCPDVIISTNLPAPVSVVINKWGRCRNSVVVTECMDSIFEHSWPGARHILYQPIRDILMRRALKQSDLVWTISSQLRAELKDVVDTAKIRNVPAVAEDETPNIEAAKSLLQSHSLLNSQFFLFSGGYDQHQGSDLVIEALRHLRTIFPDVALVMCGGTRSQVSNAKAKLNKQDGIAVAGMVSREILSGLGSLAVAHICAQLPNTFSEAGFSTKFVECLLSGTPTIASRVGEQKHVARHMEEVIYFEPGVVAGLIDAMIYLLYNRNQAINIGQRGRALARARFLPDSAFGDRIDEVLSIAAFRRRASL
jgi:glycosyltransferase involved in cell wall biosynthesis